MPLRVLHLVGSPVGDFFADLSRLYADACLTATADPARYEPTIAYVTPGGRWRFPAALDAAALAAAPSMSLAEAVAVISALAPDVAVPQLFCVPGMTVYRALLDLLAIPYVGNTPDVMALGAHKGRARAVVAAAGVPVPPAQLLRPGQRPTLALPVVVKPVDADNSVGVSLVRTAADLEEALRVAFAHAPEVLVESYVELGREVRCGVVERGGELVVLPLEEYAVDSVAKPIRDEADKLRRSATGDLELVAKDATHAWIVDGADPVAGPVGELARRCHVALGCRQYSLVDVRVDAAGQPWFLEAILYCSFAPASVIATMARAAGITLEDLFATALDQARQAAPSRRTGGEATMLSVPMAADPVGR